MEAKAIIQGSPEWHEARKSKIGASEIYTLCAHYCRKELEAMGFDLLKERPFRSIQELFLKIKFGAELSPIDPVCAEFGNGMEGYILYRLNYSGLPFGTHGVATKDFVINEKLHYLAACSPDGYVKTEIEIEDFDEKHTIDSSWGQGALELKTANYFANFGAEAGSRLQYIFQNQYQQMVLGLKWGIIAVLVPKQKEYDEPFFKGKVLSRLEIKKEISDAEGGEFTNEEIDKYYDLYHYVYPNLPVFQAMIVKALNAFQSDLDKYDADPSVFPRNSEDLNGLQREKKIWAQLWPSRFGTLTVSGDDEINHLLNQRHIAKIASIFAEAEVSQLENEIKQRTGKYCEVIGSEQKMKWASNGTVRFTKLK